MTAAGGTKRETVAVTVPRGSDVVDALRGWFERHALLLAIAAGGLVLRFWLVLGARPACNDTNFVAGAGFPPPAPLEPPRCLRLTGDSLFNYMQGKMLAEGKGFGNGFAYLDSGQVVPSAGKPPLFPLYLALLQKLGLHTVDQQRLGTSVLGAVGIVLLGMLAWRLAGRRAGLIAAGIAAVSPLLFINDGRVMVESMYVPLIAGVLLAAYSFWAKPDLRHAAVVGVMLGLASLARSEASQLFALLAIPLLLSVPRLTVKQRAALFGVVVASGFVVVLPWVGRNLATFKEPTFLQFGTGSVLLNGQCDAAYYTDSDAYGLENFKCFQGEGAPLIAELIKPKARDESQVDAEMRKLGLNYLKANLGRVPAMVAYREGRVWELYQPIDNIDKNYRFEDRGKPESVLGLVAYVLTMPLAIYGLVVLRRRRVPISPFISLVVMVSLAVAAAFGIIRFRVAVDAAAIVLAAIAVDAILTRSGRPTTDVPPSAPAPQRWRDWRGRKASTITTLAKG